jgi:hypothetical protein
MKTAKAVVLLAALAAFLALPLRAGIDAQGIKDACTASVLLERSGITSQVVVAGGEAGCIYTTGGVQYLYTTRGSARINPAHLGQVVLREVPRTEVFAIGAKRHEIRNGCLIFATCAFAGYQHDSHIVWAGIIAAQIVSASDGYGYVKGPQWYGGMNGHVLTAFETDKREVFIQENGEAPRKNDHLTELAQRGERGWCDSGTLAYCDHQIQGFTSFKSEFGHPIESVVSSPTLSSREMAGRGATPFMGGRWMGISLLEVGTSPYCWGVLLAMLGFVAWRRFSGRATLMN